MSDRERLLKHIGYTAVLVECEVHQNNALQANHEEISLDVQPCSLERSELGDQQSEANGQLASPEDISIEDLQIPAHRLDDKYRYHVFVSYNANDRHWVEDDLIHRLEAEPHNFKSCFDQRDFDKNVSEIQNIVCSIMLSERIIIVLSPSYVENSWIQYEETIAHITAISQHKQRVIVLVLEDCEIPDALKMLNYISVHSKNYWNRLLLSLQHDGVHASESTSTMWSIVSSSPGFSNGQVLSNVSARIEGCWKSCLIFDPEEVPNPFFSQEISISGSEYAELIKMIGREEYGQKMPWIYSAVPTIVLLSFFASWCIAFICVIVLYPDNTPGTLPVRLCVFVLPAIMIVGGCFLRWRAVKIGKERYSIAMFSRSVQSNKELFKRAKPVIVSTARTKDDFFNIYFLYYQRQECIEHINLFLHHCTDRDIIKLSRLIEVYTSSSGYLEGTNIAERLAVMFSSPYAIQMVFKKLPHPLEQRHTRRRQCLCQFVEEFLTAYLPCLRHEGAFDVRHLQILFLRYLNCQLKPDPIIMHTLGIGLSHIL
ncbi:uncharacterized protein LOC135487228 isoform X2 [Lineus longissimus]|uniref:uncharacterized protein LOC135487228 isoform X2 n=1 Tax=Lineus longissimus TaxID=88925 RepID=UPI002B4CD4AF